MSNPNKPQPSGEPIRQYVFEGGDFPAEQLREMSVDGSTGLRFRLQQIIETPAFAAKAKSNAQVQPEEVLRFHEVAQFGTDEPDDAYSGPLRAQVPSMPSSDPDRTPRRERN